MAYYDNVNPTLIELVDPAARRFFEFGCGSGALARAIRDKCPHVDYYAGVDLHPASIEAAGEFLDCALERNLDRISKWSDDEVLSAQAAADSFDCVLLGDVLEHLYDPLRCLTQAAALLKPEGQLLACIPNVQHWSVIAQLVHGSWPSLDAGLFDRTHIRWFTLDDMVSLFQAAGLQVTNVDPRIFDEAQGRDIMEYLEPLAMHFGLDANNVVARGLPLQYVLSGARLETPRS